MVGKLRKAEREVSEVRPRIVGGHWLTTVNPTLDIIKDYNAKASSPSSYIDSIR